MAVSYSGGEPHLLNRDIPEGRISVFILFNYLCYHRYYTPRGCSIYGLSLFLLFMLAISSTQGGRIVG